MIGPAGFMAGPKKQEPEPPPADLRCCANCAHWHKKEYIHCQCSGPWGGNIFGDKNCTFRARKVRSNVKLTSSAALVPNGGLNRRDGSVADGTSALKPLLGEDGGE